MEDMEYCVEIFILWDPDSVDDDFTVAAGHSFDFGHGDLRIVEDKGLGEIVKHF
jgi:hypothetical protein